jgi:cytochrome c556
MGLRFGRMTTAALVVGAALGAGAALAQQPQAAGKSPGAQAVATRQQNFKQLGKAFKGIIDELKKSEPDKAVIAANAAKMNSLAAQEANWFPKGSGPEAGVKTAAKPVIWSDPEGFAAAVKRLQGATPKLQQVAAAGDLSSIKAQVQATGAACKNCHDKFRVPDEH